MPNVARGGLLPADFVGSLPRRLGMGLLLAISAALVLAPVTAVIYGAFRTRPPGAPRAAFTLAKMAQAWGGVFTGGWTQAPTVNTILLALPVTVVATALGVALAWAVTRTDMPGRRTLELLFLVPLLYSPLVSVIGWTVLADPNAGLLNQAWMALTGAHAPLFDVYSYAGGFAVQAAVAGAADVTACDRSEQALALAAKAAEANKVSDKFKTLKGEAFSELEKLAEAGERFFVRLEMEGTDRRGLVADIASTITGTNTNIKSINVLSEEMGMRGEFVVEVENLEHLKRVLNAVRRVKGVIQVERREHFGGEAGGD